MYMGNRTLDAKFVKSFNHLGVTDDFIENLHDYYINGWHPGGFFESTLCNDMHRAMCRSHQLNDTKAIIGICKWILIYAPPESYGTLEKVNAWIAMTKEQRHEILQKRNIMLTPWEILGGTN